MGAAHSRHWTLSLPHAPMLGSPGIGGSSVAEDCFRRMRVKSHRLHCTYLPVICSMHVFLHAPCWVPQLL